MSRRTNKNRNLSTSSALPFSRLSRKMSVLGIDLGNESGVIAQALRGGVDIILNEGTFIASCCEWAGLMVLPTLLSLPPPPCASLISRVKAPEPVSRGRNL